MQDDNRDQDSFRSEDIDESHTTIHNMKTLTADEMRLTKSPIPTPKDETKNKVHETI